jgi:hypothetical protein
LHPLSIGLRNLNSVVIFSIGLPFPFKKIIKVALFFSTKLEVGSIYYISPSEKIFTNTVMRGKK